MTPQTRRERAATKAECLANRIMTLRETRCEPHHHYLCDECAGQWIEAFTAQEAAQAVARERERCAKVAEDWEPNGSDAQPSSINGWECEQTRFHIAAVLRQGASEGENSMKSGVFSVYVYTHAEGYPAGRPLVLAYTRYQTSDGCIHQIRASSGYEAKKQAIKDHRRDCLPPMTEKASEGAG